MSSEHLTHFDLSCVNPVEWTTNEREIIFMNAKTKNELRYLKTNFKNLENLSIRGNRLPNPFGIVNMLGESIENLDLSGNHLGEISRTAFRGLDKLKWLNLKETNLSFAESNPFEQLNDLTHLEISYNKINVE